MLIVCVVSGAGTRGRAERKPFFCSSRDTKQLFRTRMKWRFIIDESVGEYVVQQRFYSTMYVFDAEL